MNTPGLPRSKRIYLQAVVDVPVDFDLSDDVAELLADGADVRFACTALYDNQISCDCAGEGESTG